MHTATKAEEKTDKAEDKSEKKTTKAKSEEQDYATQIAVIASGIKTLTEAGVGGGEASKLAFAVWERCHCE